jgi:hypothetical protein
MRAAIVIFLAAVIVSHAVAVAADKDSVEGVLTVAGRSYKLTRAVVLRTKSSDFELLTVLASDRNLPMAEIKRMLGEKNDANDISLTQPYLTVTFSAAGEAQYCHAWADNSSFSTGGETLHGKLKLVGDRAEGEIVLDPQGEPDRKRAVTLKLNVPIGLTPGTPPSTARGPIKPSVTGKFLGNGKPAKLGFVSARPAEPFDGKPAWKLIFSEKDHSPDARADFNASFGKFGNTLIISCHEDGSIFGCEVVHSGLKKKQFSSLGQVRTDAFELNENSVRGRLTTDGPCEFFDETWESDLTFAAPLPSGAASAKKPARAKNTEPRDSDKPAESAKPAEPMPSAGTLNVYELALPNSATDLQYKALVEQLVFKSSLPVQALAGELTKSLAAQRWSSEDDDLVTPNSAILNRKRGKATLTIMIKPGGKGSQVTIFATGLNWDKP